MLLLLLLSTLLLLLVLVLMWALSQQPGLLEDLHQQLQQQLAEADPSLPLPDIPERGSLNVHRVKMSRYFFS